MLFPEKPKQLPYLADYLQYAASLRPPVQLGNYQFGFVAVLAGLAAAAVCAVAGAESIPAVVGAGLVSFGSYLAGAMRGGKAAAERPTDEQLLLAQQSREVVLRLHASMSKKRLHRDLSTEVAAVLEEASAQWSRARAALLSPYWTRPDLSQHMQTVREQSLNAAERSMQELIILFATSVPHEPGNWNLAEVVDEVFGKSVFAGAPQRRLSPFHDQAVRLVDHLRQLADEAEAISRQLIADPNLGAQSRPGGSLEATLSELRSLRQAEDELRQDMRS